jgi:hypothetical protein
MSTVAQLKARLTLETEQYMQEANKVIRKTDALSEQMGRIGRKVGKSYMNAITASVMGTVGAMSVDSMLRDLSEKLDQIPVGGANRLRDAFESVSDVVGDLIKKIPLMGGLYQFMESAYYASARANGGMEELDPRRAEDQQKAIDERRKFSESAQGAAELIRDLEYQEQLYRAATEEQRKKIEYEHELQKALEVTNKMQEGPQRDRMREDIENRMRSVQLEREKAEARKKAEEEAKRAAEQAAREKEQEANRIQREIESQQKQLESAKLNAAAELENVRGANNVQGVGTAVGSVRVAGAIDYSSKGMATSLEKIREIEKEIAENTKNLKQLRPA